MHTSKCAKFKETPIYVYYTLVNIQTGTTNYDCFSS